nr:MAG TPA: hypothetical protein [Caudoviricetes sp.]
MLISIIQQKQNKSLRMRLRTCKDRCLAIMR